MISSSALPNTISGRPNSFAVLSLNLHSLDEHDKKTIGKLSDYDILDLNGEDYVEAVDSEEEEEKANVENKRDHLSGAAFE